MKKILVTGGAGFIGSNLCQALAMDSNNKVYSLDNYSTGSLNNHLANVTYIKGDTLNIAELIQFNPDIIYHLGEYARVEQSFKDIEKLWQSNKNGTFAVLQFCRQTGAKLIYAGSSTKFSEEGQGRNHSPYAWIKASNTELVENYANWFNVSYATVYFYNVYGKNEISSGEYATLIGLFKEKTLKGESLPIVYPGTQKRNFTHVDDIVNGLLLVGENGFGNDFGIGSSEAYSVIEIAEKFGGEITMLPERKGDRMGGKLITAKTRALGWVAVKTIDDYIEYVLDGLV
jgi:UDP-glucose 4-epimerase